MEVHEGGVRIGRATDGAPVAWLREDPECAPYTVCRTGWAADLDALEKLEMEEDWDAAHDAYTSAFSSLAPREVRSIVRGGASAPTSVDLVSRDPNLPWQTLLDLEFSISAPLALPDFDASGCAGEPENDVVLYSSMPCHYEGKASSELVHEVSIAVEVPAPDGIARP